MSDHGTDGGRSRSIDADGDGSRTTTARLLGPADVRVLAERLGLRPTKKLGQNFVHDANTVRRIVKSAGVDGDDVVLEVGPGLGSLTLALLPVAARVHVVEIDPVLAGLLPDTVAERAPELAGRLTVTGADAMRVGADRLATDAGPGAAPPTAIVANLPYNVAVPVILHLLAELPSLRTGLVMVQAEVADRLAAGPGSREYGAPSAKLAWYAGGPPRRAGAARGVLAGPRRRLRTAGLHPARPARRRRPGGDLRGRRRGLRPAPQGAAGSCRAGRVRPRRPNRPCAPPASTPPRAPRPSRCPTSPGSPGTAPRGPSRLTTAGGSA